MFGKDFREARADAQNFALLCASMCNCGEQGNAASAAETLAFELETHLLSKFVNGAHPAFGSALEIRDLQRHFTRKK
jgi:hypothetical protein